MVTSHNDAGVAEPATGASWSRLPLKLQVAILLQLPPNELLRLAPVSKHVRVFGWGVVSRPAQHALVFLVLPHPARVSA